jgi:hypothetical protein
MLSGMDLRAIGKKSVYIFGWYGAAAILAAYALLSFDILTATGLVYQLLNMTGAMGIALASFSKRDYPPVALNVVWVMIALFALLRIVLG